MSKDHRSAHPALIGLAIVAVLAGIGLYARTRMASESAGQYTRQSRQAKPKDAERLLRKALDLRPDEAFLYVMLADRLLQQDKVEESIKVLEKGLAIAKKDRPDDLLTRRFRTMLAEIYQEQGDYDKAIEYRKDNLLSWAGRGSQGFARSSLAELYAKKGDYKSAAKEYEAVLRAGRPLAQPEMYWQSAYYRAKLGEGEKALQHLARLFAHPTFEGVVPHDRSNNTRSYGTWLENLKTYVSFKQLRSLPGYQPLITLAQRRVDARTRLVSVYRRNLNVPGFRLDPPMSPGLARNYAQQAGFSHDVLLSYGNEGFINSEYGNGDDRMYKYGFGGCYYLFTSPENAKIAFDTTRKLKFQEADWSRVRWTSRALKGSQIGDETISADDKNGNLRLVVRKGNFLGVFYTGNFDKTQYEQLPPNVAGAIDMAARQVVEMAVP